MHQALTAQQLEERLAEPCILQQADTDCHPPSPEAPGPSKKLTRLQVIRNILQDQEKQPPAQAQHQLEETTGYLRCIKCGTSIHKRTNEQAFTDYINSPCLDGPFEAQHGGHHTHQLWRKGNRISCKQCGIQLHLDSNQRIILTASLLKECKGAGIKGSPSIQSFFKPTPPTPSGGGSTEKQGSGTGTPTTTEGPKPKRLHFPTPLTEREDEPSPTQAMTPSPPAGEGRQTRGTSCPQAAEQPTARATGSQETPEEESLTDDGMEVDYF